MQIFQIWIRIRVESKKYQQLVNKPKVKDIIGSGGTRGWLGWATATPDGHPRKK
jgi:hypothetical protein